MDPHLKGDFTEAIVIAELKRRNIPVATPFGDNNRYDIVVETPTAKLLRIQIKTGWFGDGVVEFRGLSQHTNSKGNTYKRYEDDVDYFIVYCDSLETLYLVEESKVGSGMYLRVDEPKQLHPDINWAENYEFDQRWPVKAPEYLTENQASDPLSERVVEALRTVGSTVYRSTQKESNRRLVAEIEDKIYRLYVVSGWVADDRIHFEDKSEKPVDCYFIYCEEVDQLYVVRDFEFDSTITLRVNEPKKRNRRMNYAQDYEFEINWPPNSRPHPDHPLNPAISKAVDLLEKTGSNVEYDDDDGTNQTLTVDTSSQTSYHVRIEEGWKENGRVRFVPKGEDIDYYVVYCDELDELYIVADDAFNASFSFRVDEPIADDPTINWAEDFLLEKNWPPEELENDSCR